MGKFTAGMLLGVVASILFAVPATAAEIPPTELCVGHFKKYWEDAAEIQQKNANPGWKKNQYRRLNKEFINTDCISDFNWLMKPGKAKPYTEQCRQGAEEARAYWDPISKEFRPVADAYTRRANPLYRRIADLQFKVILAQINGRKQARISRLRDRIAVLRKSRARVEQTYGKAFRKVLFSQIYQTNLIFYELSSRRCVGPNTDLEKSPVPVARAINRYRQLVYSSVIYLMSKVYAEAVAVDSASSSAGQDALGENPFTAYLPAFTG